MSWKQAFKSFRKSDPVDHEVCGVHLKFYPQRIAYMLAALDLSAPVGKAISVLFADESRDSTSRVKRQHGEDSGDQFLHEDICTEAISIEMAQHRQAERDRAIEEIVGTVADPRSMILLGKLFMDSLRDVFPYKVRRQAQEVEEWLFGVEGEEDNDGLDMPTMVGLFTGWMKANAKVFGSSGGKMVGIVRDRLEALKSSPSEEEQAEPTSGQTSSTPSSLPSDMASQPST